MKKLLQTTLLLAVLLFVAGNLRAQYRYLDNTFDTDLGIGWTTESAGTTDTWTATDGVAGFIGQQLGTTASLLTPVIDLSKSVQPIFRFDYRSDQFDGHIDQLTVYARTSPDTRWIPLFEDGGRRKDFTTHSMLLPDTLISSTVQFRFESLNNGGAGIQIDNVTVVESNACTTAPEGFLLTFVSHDTAAFVWLTDTSAVNTRFLLSTAPVTDFENIDETKVVHDKTMPADRDFNVLSVNGLVGGIRYHAYVQADCAYGDLSPWAEISFTTICEPHNTPYDDGFDDYTDTDFDCWRISADDSGSLPKIMPKIGDADNAGKAVHFTVAKDKYSYLYTPEFAVDDISKMALTVDLYSEKVGLSTFSTEIVVGVISNPVDMSTFFPLHTITPTEVKQWQTIDVSFSDYTGDAEGNIGKFIAFRVGNAEKQCDLWIDNVHLDEAECFAPQMVRVDDIRAKQARLTWTDMGGSQDFKVRISDHQLTAAELSASSSDDIVVLTDTAVVTGLLPGTKHYAYIQSDCGAWSEVMEFTTAAVLSVGYKDDFSTHGTQIPSDWLYGAEYLSTKQFVVSAYNSVSIVLAPNYNHEGSAVGSLKFNQTKNTNPFIIFPELDVDDIKTVQLRLWSSFGNTKEGINVGICTSRDISTVEHITTLYPEGSANQYYEYVITFDEYEGEGKYIALYSTFGKAASTTIVSYIDDLAVEPLNSCNRPRDLEVGRVLSSTAVLDWSRSGSALGKFEVQYRTDDATEWQSAFVDTDSAELKDLQSGVTYHVRVRTVCDATPGAETYSDWSLTETFRTMAVMTVPYYNDFTEETTGAGKWPTGWFCFNDKSTTASDIPYVAATAWSVASGTKLPEDIKANSLCLNVKNSQRTYAVMPEFPSDKDIKGYSVEFYLHTNITMSGYSHRVEVGIMTDPTDPSTFVSVGEATIATPKVCQYEVIPLKSYTGDGRYIAFRAGNDDVKLKTQLFVDNVKVDVTSECIRVQGVKMDEVGQTDATLSWNLGNAETEWNIRLFDHKVDYDQLTDAEGNLFTAGSTSERPLKLTQLNPNTQYWVAVQSKTANCTADWSDIVTFRTKCPDTYPVSYFEDFDSYSNNFVPYCYISKGGASANAPFKPMTNTASARTCPDYQYGVEKGNTMYLCGNQDYYSYLILPQFNDDITSLQLSFHGRSNNKNYLRQIEIGVMESIDDTFLDPSVSGKDKPTSDSLFTLIRQIELRDYQTWERVIATFDEYKGKGKHIALRLKGTKDKVGGRTYYSEMYIDHLKVEPIPNCSKVLDLTVMDSTTATTAMIKWTAKGEQDWDIILSESPISPIESDRPTFSVKRNLYRITDLKPNTRYWVYVRRDNKAEDCVGEWSDAVEFITECSSVDFGFFDSFESNKGYLGKDVKPRCWITSGTSTQLAYPALKMHGKKSHADSVYLVIPNESWRDVKGNENHVYTSYAALPELNVDSIEQAQISFRAYSGLSQYGRFEVGVMTDPLEPSTFVSVYSGLVPEDKDQTNEYAFYTINFLDYVTDDYGEKGKHIAFRVLPAQDRLNPDYVGRNEIYIDSVLVEAYDPCSKPVALTADTLTDTSVTLSWLSSAAERYRVLILRDTSIATTPLVDTVVLTNPAEIVGLPANTCLYARIAVICDGEDTPEWSKPLVFRTTGCNDGLPYIESFEEVPRGSNYNRLPYVVPACYNAYSTNTKIGYGNPGDTAAMESYSRINCGSAYIARVSDSRTGVNSLSIVAAGYAFLPDFNVENIGDLSMRLYWTPTKTDDMEIGVIEDVYDISTYTPLMRLPGATGRQLLEIDFARFAGIPDGARIAIRNCGKDVSSPSQIYIDDVTIDYTSRMLSTPSSLRCVMATDHSVAVNWSDFGYAEQYQVAIVERGGNIADADLFTTDTAYYDFTGLLENHQYDVLVRSCRGTAFSDWTDRLAVQTYRKAAGIPYTCDFNDDTENSQWVLTALDEDLEQYPNYWTIGEGVAANDTKALYITDNGTDWQYSYGAQGYVNDSKSWAYRTLNIEHAGVYIVELKLRTTAYKKNLKDFVSVGLIPASYIPTIGGKCVDVYSGTDYNMLRGNVIPMSNPLAEDWTPVSVEIRIDEPGYYNLLCYWYNGSTNKDATSTPAAIDSVRVYESDCFAPENLRLSQRTDTLLGFSWDGGIVEAWDVIVGAIDVAKPDTLSGSNLIAKTQVDTAAYRLVVDAGTSVVFYVREACHPDAKYLKLAASSACFPKKLPYVEDLTLPAAERLDCWLTPSGKKPSTYTHRPDFTTPANTSARIQPNDIVIMPLLEKDIKHLQIQFKAAHDKGLNAATTFELGVITNPFDASSFESLMDINTQGRFLSEMSAQFDKFYYNFAAYQGSARYIAFRALFGTFYIDDIVVSETPACAQPFDLTVSDVTTTTADLSWLTVPGQDRWRVIVTDLPDLSGSYLDTMTTALFDDTVTVTTAHITGIAHSTTYYAYIRSICGTEGNWSVPASFTTDTKPFTLPYAEDFTVVLKDRNLPEAWSRYETPYADHLAGNDLRKIQVENALYREFVVDQSQTLSSTMDSWETFTVRHSWVASPAIVIDEKALLSFDLKLGIHYSGDVLTANRQSHFRLCISNDDGKTWHTNPSVLVGDAPDADYSIDYFTDTLHRVYVDLAQYLGDTIRFAYYVECVDATGLKVLIDNITIRCTVEEDHTDIAYENHDYTGHGYHFPYDALTPGDTTLTRYANSTDPLTCDSIIRLTLDIRPTRRHTIEDMLCHGDHLYDKHNFTVTAPGTYIHRATATTGADSITTLILTSATATPPVTIHDTICSDDTYTFAGRPLNITGIYRDTTGNRFGCDSVTILNLTVADHLTVRLTDTICHGDTYTFAGHPLRTTGIYRDTTLSAAKCDSITILDLSVLGGDTLTVTDTLTTADLPYRYRDTEILPVGTTPAIHHDTLDLLVPGTACTDHIRFSLLVTAPSSTDPLTHSPLILSPNPVHAGGTVYADLYLPTTVTVRITLYDTSGRLISTHHHPSGRIAITAPATSGLYLIRLTTPDGTVRLARLTVR